MASATKFVGDFRAAVSAMIDSFQHTAGLLAQAQAMGWVQDDFTQPLQGSDITPEQLMQAMETVGGLAAQFGDQAVILARLKQ